MSKQKTIKGTRPTIIQRKILERNKCNPNDYMFVKEIIELEDDAYNSSNRKSLNKSSPKIRYMQFVNKNDGSLLKLKGV